MDYFKEAERLLKSGNVKNEQLGVGLAMLALCEKLGELIPKINQVNSNSLGSRKPEEGDIKVFYCKVCARDNLFTFKESVPIGKNWLCSGCGKTLTCSRSS